MGHLLENPQDTAGSSCVHQSMAAAKQLGLMRLLDYIGGSINSTTMHFLKSKQKSHPHWYGSKHVELQQWMVDSSDLPFFGAVVQ